MEKKTISDLEEQYDLELDNVIGKIKKNKAKLVLLQFPDGLKPYATVVVDYLQENTQATFLIWFGDCFGACDTPVSIENIKPKIDLVILFGHNELMPQY